MTMGVTVKTLISNEWSQCSLPLRGTIPEDASFGHLGVRYEIIPQMSS